MNRSAIDDQNNDNIVDEPQDILEEDVEDADDNNNEVVHISCPLWQKARFYFFFKQYFGFFRKKSKYCVFLPSFAYNIYI